MLLTQSTTPIIGWIATLLGYVMEFIFYCLNFIGIQNIGLCIIIFTIIVRLLMLPLTINKMELLRCLDRSTLFVKESDKKPIILKIENEQMNLMISSQIGSMKDQIAISKEGKDLVIGFNPKFLVDALRVIDEEEVTIYLINSIAPCIIRDEKSSYLYLILPINVSNSNV